MNIARVLYPVKVLGPGNRIAIWTAGCPRRCSGCSNPELWECKVEYEIPIERVVAIIDGILKNYTVDGITITGGDPFYQPEALLNLLKCITEKIDDILVYTGYSYEELKKMSSLSIKQCLDKIDVLIDGPYIAQLNCEGVLRGSTNQHILFLNNDMVNKYEAYINDLPRYAIQNFDAKDGVVSVGIHRPNFKKDLSYWAKVKGGILLESKE